MLGLGSNAHKLISNKLSTHCNPYVIPFSRSASNLFNSELNYYFDLIGQDSQLIKTIMFHIKKNVSNFT